MKIIDFLQVSENIASSAQPSKDDFQKIKELGYSTIINLALSTSDNAIPTEGDIVINLGMSYVHLPIQWHAPTLDQFHLFVATMQQQSKSKVWVHCALNMRVSVFLYLYNTIYLNVTEQVALKKLHEVWQPNEIWSQFITNVQSTHNK